jgi:hypothetical protein
MRTTIPSLLEKDASVPAGDQRRHIGQDARQTQSPRIRWVVLPPDWIEFFLVGSQALEVAPMRFQIGATGDCSSCLNANNPSQTDAPTAPSKAGTHGTENRVSKNAARLSKAGLARHKTARTSSSSAASS